MYKFDLIYCNNCGQSLDKIIPEGDERLRSVCLACGAIHYQNPKIISGCLIEVDNKILLCKRNIEPQLGKWTLPAGFMENNETCEQAAARETREEANAEVTDLSLFAVYDIPYISQVYMIYKGQLKTPSFSPGIESQEVALFDRHDLPWELLAFSVIKTVLVDYFNDQDTQKIALHTGVITPEMKLQLALRPEGF